MCVILCNENIIDFRLAITTNVILKLSPLLDVWLGISLSCVTRAINDKNAIAKITRFFFLL